MPSHTPSIRPCQIPYVLFDTLSYPWAHCLEPIQFLHLLAHQCRRRLSFPRISSLFGPSSISPSSLSLNTSPYLPSTWASTPSVFAPFPHARANPRTLFGCTRRAFIPFSDSLCPTSSSYLPVGYTPRSLRGVPASTSAPIPSTLLENRRAPASTHTSSRLYSRRAGYPSVMTSIEISLSSMIECRPPHL